MNYRDGYELNCLNYVEGVKWGKEAKEHFLYTLKHKKALLMVYTELYGTIPSNNSRLYYHDIDKLFMYTILSDIKKASKLHRGYSTHHVENWRVGNLDDRIEALLDYECARITKPDKPLNAYRTVNELKIQAKDDLEPLLKEVGLWSPDNKEFEFRLFHQYAPVIEENIFNTFAQSYDYLLEKYSEMVYNQGISVDVSLKNLLIDFYNWIDTTSI